MEPWIVTAEGCAGKSSKKNLLGKYGKAMNALLVFALSYERAWWIGSMDFSLPEFVGWIMKNLDLG
jgi:hypothetical protein